jgi:hypothetical protein
MAFLCATLRHIERMSGGARKFGSFAASPRTPNAIFHWIVLFVIGWSRLPFHNLQERTRFADSPGQIQPEGKWMKTKVGALLFGAAILSLFFPKRHRQRRNEASARSPEAPPRRMYALVQTRPRVIVLAVSPKIEELEREIIELNETWNHWAMRSERRRFEIQPAPVLVATPSVAARSRVQVVPRG